MLQIVVFFIFHLNGIRSEEMTTMPTLQSDSSRIACHTCVAASRIIKSTMGDLKNVEESFFITFMYRLCLNGAFRHETGAPDTERCDLYEALHYEEWVKIYLALQKSVDDVEACTEIFKNTRFQGIRCDQIPHPSGSCDPLLNCGEPEACCEYIDFD